MRTIFVVAVIVAVAAGCSASKEPGAGPDTTLTAAQWRRQANALCRNVGRELQGIPRPKAESEIADFIVTILPLWKREEDGMRVLEPPAALATSAGEFVQAISYLNVALLEIHISTQRHDGARRYSALQRLRAAEQGVRRRGRALGLPACARQRMPLGL